MKTRKQRQFERKFGYYLVQFRGGLLKIQGKKTAAPTREEVEEYLHFQPTRPWLQLIEDFKWFGELFRMMYESFKLKQAKILADAKSKAYGGRRYFVLPDWNGKYRVLNRGQIKQLQRKGIMSKKATIMDLTNEALYYTDKNMRHESA